MAAVQQSATALEYAHETMQKDFNLLIDFLYMIFIKKIDKDVVMISVKKDGNALRFAHEIMKKGFILLNDFF